MDEKLKYAKLLRSLADLIEISSEPDLQELLAGRAFLAISFERHRLSRSATTRIATRKKPQQPGAKNLIGIIDKLRQLGSREEGLQLLLREGFGKKDLEKLARLMDLPVLREDDAERLRQKMVEESIGSRLNSRAIRGQ